jgi:hypothetical protein
VNDYKFDILDGIVTLSWSILENGKEKTRKGRFIVVPDDNITTNLAFGTSYLEPTEEAQPTPHELAPQQLMQRDMMDNQSLGGSTRDIAA